jgi:hypothetical protein
MSIFEHAPVSILQAPLLLSRFGGINLFLRTFYSSFFLSQPFVPEALEGFIE